MKERPHFLVHGEVDLKKLKYRYLEGRNVVSSNVGIRS